MKHRMMTFFVGLLCGAALFGGATAVAAGITAQPAWSPIYVDGQQVQMTAYNILGNNYVKLRDIGQAVGFNVYYQNGVQVDSTAPYTGEAPAQATATTGSSVRVSSYKGNTLNVGDRSGLIIGPSGTSYTVTSSNPDVISVENVSGNWVAVAKASGSADIIVSDGIGNSGRLTLTVGSTVENVETAASGDPNLTANMDARQEMIRLINQVRQENGAPGLIVNQSLMDAAQEHAARQYTTHHRKEECETALAHGYPHGFACNLTVFANAVPDEIAQRAVRNWKNSLGHFRVMIDPDNVDVGVGVVTVDGWTYCYLFLGEPGSYNPYG